MIESLDYVTLFVPDLEADVRFYRDGLGLVVLQESPSFTLLSAGNCRIGLHAGEQRSGASSVNLHFRVGDVDAACAELARRGPACAEAPRNQPWGLRSATFVDPAGYRVELVGPLA